MAGWIFADLLLVLFLVGLGSAIAYTPPEPPKPEPEPPAIPRIVGMKTDPTSVTVGVDGELLGDGGRLTEAQQKKVCRAVSERVEKVKGERAALVLIFGGAEDVTVGQNIARAVGEQLKCADPKVFKGKVPSRPFWDGSLPLGQVRLEIFLFLQQVEKR